MSKFEDIQVEGGPESKQLIVEDKKEPKPPGFTEPGSKKSKPRGIKQEKILPQPLPDVQFATIEAEPTEHDYPDKPDQNSYDFLDKQLGKVGELSPAAINALLQRIDKMQQTSKQHQDVYSESRLREYHKKFSDALSEMKSPTDLKRNLMDNDEPVEQMLIGTSTPLPIVAQPDIPPQPNPTPYVEGSTISPQVLGTEQTKPEPKYERKLVASSKKGSKKSSKKSEPTDLTYTYERLKSKQGEHKLKDFSKYTVTINTEGIPTIKSDRGAIIKHDKNGVYTLVNDSLKKRRIQMSKLVNYFQ